MRPESKRVLKPKLRFPEFRDSPGWTEIKLADVLTEHGLKSDGNCKVHSVSVHKGIVDQIEHLGRRYAAADTSNYNLVKPYDIVYTKSPTGDFPFGIVKQSLHPDSVIVSPLYGVFSPINRHLGYILDAYFESPIRTNNYLAPITQKGAKNTIQISNQTFLSKSIYLPSDEREHQQIAGCLSSLDELIAALGQELDALKTHKNGLMQELFPHAGETRPRLRFPEFRDAPEWVPHKFGDFVVESFYGTSESTSDKGQYPVLRMGNMVGGGLDLTNLVYIDLDSEKFEAIRLKKGDILLNRTNSRELVGKISLFEMESEYIAASYIVAFRLNTNEFHPSFCNLMLNTQLYQAKIKLLATPSISQANINPTTFRNNLDILIPTKSEQRRIANCISSLGEMILAQTQKLETLKIHKKGLMQQLFPSSEEAL